MSVIIPTMNLPKGCGDCPFANGSDFREIRCLADPSLYIRDGSEYTRDSKCPLKECDSTETPEWIYHHIPGERYNTIDFEAIEKALGFRLFAWQKSYVLTKGREYRCSGRTTAEILQMLFDVEQYNNPINFSISPRNRRSYTFRQQFRDIWEKLHDAGIEMRPVLWSKDDKKKYEKEHHDPYKYARTWFDEYEKGE